MNPLVEVALAHLSPVSGLALGWFLVVSGCGTPDALAEATGLQPGPFDPYTASMVAELITTQHYEQGQIDDDVSAAWLDRYIDSLDPDHSIFLAEDVESFMRFRHRLDDDVRQDRARLTVAFEIYDRYVERLQDRLQNARAQLDQPVDFTLDERIRVERDEAPWPTTAAEADDIWRRRIKDDLLVGELTSEARDEVIERLQRRYDRYAKELIADTEAIDVLEIYLSALTRSLDPHSAYFKPATSDDFDIDLSNSLEGIGAELSTDDDWITVVRRLIPGGPADLDGDLQPEDKIVAVAQGEGEAVDVVGLKIGKVVKLIRGPAGTEVRLTVVSKGEDSSMRRVVSIVRDKVELKDKLAEKRVDTVERDGRRVKVGTIELREFYTPRQGEEGPRAADDVRRHLGELETEGAAAVVLDLRANGGGSLPEAIKLAGLFVPTGPMVQVDDPRRGLDEMPDPDPDVAWSGPLVVLTSPASASASEIVAGAVQDYGRGLIVGGERTHGKGTVQSLIGLAEYVQLRARSRMREDMSGALKLTTQKFYRVSGGSTQARGIASDVVLPSPWDGWVRMESELENFLPWDDKPAAHFRPVGEVQQHAEELQQLSTGRVAADADFEALRAAISLRREKPTWRSLNLEERREDYDRRREILGHGDDAPEDALAADDETADPDNDPVLREALQITADFVMALSREG